MYPILDHLRYLYGDELGRETFEQLSRLMDRYRSQVASPVTGGVSERDAIIITYADQIRESGVPPLRTLVEFSSKWMQGVVSGIHMLPFYPASSDDGFSVIDYKSVDPALGDWEDIHTLRKSFRLMFDAVINHVSSQSDWFQDFLQDRIPYRDYFITVEGGVDLSQVVRPRALPLLTSFNTISGNKSVWTTFSSDQIDLDFRNPRVLLEIMEVLLFYISQGAEFIRLDAIAYLWKEIGGSCIHLPQTHHLVQLIRAVLDDLAPHVQLITETNVPHAENISYFGDGSNEAQMVYNFALPPLVLHTFLTGNAAGITRWAAKLELPSSHVTFFNFLASHDGIGITPANGLISPAEIDALVEQAQAHGGLVSFRTNPDGSQSPYELNINYFDALSDPEGEESLSTQIDRFLAAHALMLSLVGVPGIYFHSLFGSRSWREGVTQTGRYRTINRQKLHLPDLESELGSAGSRRAVVYQRLAHMLRSRAAHPAFHPYGLQNVMELDARLFAILRTSTDHRSHVLCLINVSGQSISVELPLDLFPFNINPYPLDLIRGRRIQLDRSNRLSLMPYQVFWLMPPKY